MIRLTVTLDGDGAFEHFKDKKVLHLSRDAPPIKIALLKKGMTSGKSAVVIGIDIGNGEAILAETSLKVFMAVSELFRDQYLEENL